MAYVVSLKDFEGPLDLLLHLISRAKVRIEDIFVSEITEQYLASIEDLSGLDMDAASEFLQMAATLLEIKSRALLPRPPAELEEGEEHQHTDDCYATVRGELICKLEETAPAEPKLICGLEEHIHSDSCYEEEPPAAGGGWCRSAGRDRHSRRTP